MGSVATWQTGLFLTCVLAGAVWARTDVRRLAVVVGVVFPIDFLTGVSSNAIDAVRYTGAIALIVLARVDLPPPARRVANRLVALLAVLALIRIMFSLAHGDGLAARHSAVMLMGAAIALPIAYRRQIHLPLVAGWFMGLVLSGAVALMQALDLPTLRQPELDNSRYPGVSHFTMTLTLQMAYAVVLAVYVIAVTRDRPRIRALAVVAAVTCLLALLVNGAQGGLLGLAAAALAAAWVFRRSLTWQRIRLPLALTTAVAVLAAVAVQFGWLELATLDGVLGDGGFENEKARWTVFKAAWREIADHPVTGLGRTTFIDRYTISPHNLALDSGVIAGIVGLVAGIALLGYTVAQWLRGPGDGRPETITAFVLIAALLPSFFTETNGPYFGLVRMTIMVIAVLTVLGHLPAQTDPTPDPRIRDVGASTPS